MPKTKKARTQLEGSTEGSGAGGPIGVSSSRASRSMKSLALEEEISGNAATSASGSGSNRPPKTSSTSPYPSLPRTTRTTRSAASPPPESSSSSPPTAIPSRSSLIPGLRRRTRSALVPAPAPSAAVPHINMPSGHEAEQLPLSLPEPIQCGFLEVEDRYDVIAEVDQYKPGGSHIGSTGGPPSDQAGLTAKEDDPTRDDVDPRLNTDPTEGPPRKSRRIALSRRKVPGPSEGEGSRSKENQTRISKKGKEREQDTQEVNQKDPVHEKQPTSLRKVTSTPSTPTPDLSMPFSATDAREGAPVNPMDALEMLADAALGRTAVEADMVSIGPMAPTIGPSVPISASSPVPSAPARPPPSAASQPSSTTVPPMATSSAPLSSILSSVTSPPQSDATRSSGRPRPHPRPRGRIAPSISIPVAAVSAPASDLVTTPASAPTLGSASVSARPSVPVSPPAIAAVNAPATAPATAPAIAPATVPATDAATPSATAPATPSALLSELDAGLPLEAEAEVELEPEPEPDLQRFTLVELRASLFRRGLNTSGKKAHLIRRVLENVRDKRLKGEREGAGGGDMVAVGESGTRGRLKRQAVARPASAGLGEGSSAPRHPDDGAASDDDRESVYFDTSENGHASRDAREEPAAPRPKRARRGKPPTGQKELKRQATKALQMEEELVLADLMEDKEKNGPSVSRPFPEGYEIPHQCAIAGRNRPRDDDGADQETRCDQGGSRQKDRKPTTLQEAEEILARFLPARDISVDEQAATDDDAEAPSNPTGQAEPLSGPTDDGGALNQASAAGSAHLVEVGDRTPSQQPSGSRFFCCASCRVSRPLVNFSEGVAGCEECGTVDPASRAGIYTGSYETEVHVQETAGLERQMLRGKYWKTGASGKGSMVSKALPTRETYRTKAIAFIERTCTLHIQKDPLTPPMLSVARISNVASRLMSRTIDRNLTSRLGNLVAKSQRSGKVDIATHETMEEAGAAGAGEGTTIWRLLAMASVVVAAKQQDGMDWLSMELAVQRGWIDANPMAIYRSLRMVHEVNPASPDEDKKAKPPPGPFADLLLKAKTILPTDPRDKKWQAELRVAANTADPEDIIEPIVSHLANLVEDFAANRLCAREQLAQPDMSAADYIDSSGGDVINERVDESHPPDIGDTTANRGDQKPMAWTARFVNQISQALPLVEALAIRIMDMFEATREIGKDRLAIASACVLCAMMVLAGEGLIRSVEIMAELCAAVHCKARSGHRCLAELLTMVIDWAQYLSVIGLHWRSGPEKMRLWFTEAGHLAMARAHLFVVMLPNVIENAMELNALAQAAKDRKERAEDFYRDLYKLAQPDAQYNSETMDIGEEDDVGLDKPVSADSRRVLLRRRLSSQSASESKGLRSAARIIQASITAILTPGMSGGTTRVSSNEAAEPRADQSDLVYGFESDDEEGLTDPSVGRKAPRLIVVGQRIPHVDGWTSYFADAHRAPLRRAQKSGKKPLKGQAKLAVPAAKYHDLSIEVLPRTSQGIPAINPYDSVAVTAVRRQGKVKVSRPIIDILTEWQDERIDIDKAGKVALKSDSARHDYEDVTTTAAMTMKRHAPRFNGMFVRRWLLEGKAPKDLPTDVMPTSVTAARVMLGPGPYIQTSGQCKDDKLLFSDGEADTYIAPQAERILRERMYIQHGGVSAEVSRASKQAARSAKKAVVKTRLATKFKEKRTASAERSKARAHDPRGEEGLQRMDDLDDDSDDSEVTPVAASKDDDDPRVDWDPKAIFKTRLARKFRRLPARSLSASVTGTKTTSRTAMSEKGSRPELGSEEESEDRGALSDTTLGGHGVDNSDGEEKHDDDFDARASESSDQEDDL